MLLAQYGVLTAAGPAGGGWRLVEKLPVSDDGRGQTVRITASGREMRRRIWAIYGASIAERMDGGLSAQELKGIGQPARTAAADPPASD
ncbi:hypothetical protein ACVOMV_11320 [Mesorhizobium atlanticum]